jgi:cell surface protein SprA
LYRNNSNFDNQEITLYYKISFPKIKSSGIILSSYLLFAMVLSLVLATHKNNSLYDYKFYANTRLTVFSRTPFNKTNFLSQRSSSLFNVIPPLISLDPVKFFDKFIDFDGFKVLPDTTKPDTTKKQDTVKVKDTTNTIPKTTDQSKIDTTKLDSASLSAMLHEDTVKFIRDPHKDSLLAIQDSIQRALLDSIMDVDSTRMIDTIALKSEKRLAIYDSTARIKNLTYKLPSTAFAPFTKETYHPVFGQKSSAITYEVKIDTVSDMVTISEKINGVNTRIPTIMTLDDYIALLRNYYTQHSWEELAHRYELKKEDKEIGSLLSNITNIDIPIPENPLMSIFGDRSRINLRITGAVDIKGAFRTQKTEGATLSALGNTRSEPDFKQTVSIQVDGTVGDKLSINANWDTQRTFDFENQLKIAYKGYEDEIIQSIEAGNVGVSSTSSLVGSSQALFGIKVNWLMGPLKLTTVASQKKSEKKEVAVSGGSQKSSFDIKAWNYSNSHYFIDASYRDTWEPYYNRITPEIKADLQILEMEVWVTRPGSIERADERSVVADIDLPALADGASSYGNKYDNSNSDPGRIEVGKFIKLSTDQYTFNEYTGVITLNTSVAEDQAIAVAYKTVKKKVYGYFSNTLDSAQSTLILKLVKPKNLIPSFKKAWSQVVKSIYAIGGRGITKTTLENVKIWYFDSDKNQDVDNIDGYPILEILGVDKYDESGSGSPDGKLDFFDGGRVVNGQRGEIIFPYLEPFREAFVNFSKNGAKLTDPSKYVFGDVYDTTSIYAQQNTVKNRFSIKGAYSGSSSDKYTIGMSVVPGSVKVYYNGTELIAGVDYVIDEIGGQVIIKKEEALVPGANVQIKYEENDLISFASKTLLGATGEMDIGSSTKLGFSWINSVQQTLSDKVRLGEEPINNHIFGLAGTSSFDLPFLTNALNYLPLFSSKDASSISLHAEGAYILPDPNTKKSNIDGDNDQSVAYIDDFEGARQYIPLGSSWGVWHYPSAPAELKLPQFVSYNDSVIMGYKAKTYWYNKTPSDVAVKEIWPERSTAAGDEQQTYLSIVYDPALRGAYNYSPTLDNKKYNWGGIMRCLGSNVSKLKAQNYTCIEIWMKVEGKDLSNAKMYIDLGRITEKVITSTKILTKSGLHTEDGKDGTMNGLLDDGEDLGLDRMTDAQEREAFPELGDDPSLDNYSYVQSGNDYSNVNGQQGNGTGLSDLGRVPDTEDLNKNGVQDQTNSYFEYEIILDSLQAKSRQQIVGGGNSGWYQFRIPLTDYVKSIGTPDLDQVESIRVWVTGTTQIITLKLAQFDVVGNQWQALQQKDTAGVLYSDTTFKVTVVSIEETPEYAADLPPGVKRAVDRTRPDQNIVANEQSLALEFKSIPEGETREVIKYLSGMDVFSYKNMRLFVHGDKLFQYTNVSDYDAEFYFRFGVDTANYYEYKMPLKPGWDNDNNILIEFAKLTSVKQLQTKDALTQKLGAASLAVEGKPGATYGIFGNPSLQALKFLLIGIRNPKNKGTKLPLAGSIWIDELRLTQADNTPGWAIRADGSLKISSLANVSFNYSQTNPDFHSVDARFGSRSNDKSWGINGNIMLSSILPKEVFGQNLNVTFSHTESINDPKYTPGTDIKIDDAADALLKSTTGDAATNKKAADSLRTVSQTVTVNESFAVPNIQLRIPVKYWLVEETFNKLSFNFNYNTSRQRSPLIEWSNRWAWSFSSSYNLSLSRLLSVSPFVKLFDGVTLFDQYKNITYTLLPEMAFSFSASRSDAEEKQRTELKARAPQRSFTASRSMSAKFKFIDGGLLNPGVDYSVNVSSNYTHLETKTDSSHLERRDSTGAITILDTIKTEQRSTKDIFKEIFWKNGKFDFGIDNNYSQDISVNTNLQLPKVWKLEEFMTITLGDYKAGYKWTYNYAQLDKGKSSNMNTSISPSINFKLKALGDKIFGTDSPSSGGNDAQGRSRRADEIQQPQTDSTGKVIKPAGGGGLKIMSILRPLIKVPFFDFETINITFSQQNTSQNSGLPGRSGFDNMWARIPFYEGPNDENGPSREYQLGLTADPTARLRFATRSTFPFIGFDVIPGLRVPTNKDVQFTDNFAQTNNLGLSTSRTLFENISLNFNWKVTWGYNRNVTFNTDSLGVPLIVTRTVSRNIDRTFIALPDFFLFNIFGSGGIKKVAELYAKSYTEGETSNQNEKLADAFEKGFEFFPVLSKIFGSIAPRANWSIRWGGLEKIPFISTWANSLSLTHAYTSSQTKKFRDDPSNSSKTITDGQRIAYNFSPLLGVDLTFKELFGGNFNSSFRISSGASYDLSSGTTNITESNNQEISASAGFSKQGLQIPLFGLYLKNDIDFSLTISYSGSARKMYKIEGTELSTDGTSDDSSGRTSFEPRFRYVISSKVTGSVYYRYSKTSGARVSSTTTNEGGLDVHIGIN